MGLTPQFSQADIKAYVDKKLIAYHKAIVMRLRRSGEEFVTLAKEKGEYRDRTGNLRSAPFYIVLYDGVTLLEDLGSKAEASAKSKELIDKLISKFSSGYALICGDGMEYAAAVESMGKDVITGSTQIIEDKLKQALRNMKYKANGS